MLTSYEPMMVLLGSCNCADGEDNDADGWFDLEDPDCNGSEFGAEIGFYDSSQTSLVMMVKTMMVTVRQMRSMFTVGNVLLVQLELLTPQPVLFVLFQRLRRRWGRLD